MPAIGIVDDRPEMRETIRRTLQRGLTEHEGWQAIDVPPFVDLAEYPGWIAANEITVMLTDERLHEVVEPGGGRAANYDGHQLVDFLRERFPVLPIFVVTAYPRDESVQQRFGSVEDVINKDDFSEHARDYTRRFVRVGGSFFTEHRSELERLSELSRLIATGEATREEMGEARALQEHLGLPLANEMPSRSDWVTALEEKAEKLEELDQAIRRLLSSGQA